MDGATSLITGGARGIGLASAIALAKEGSNIVLYDVDIRVTSAHTT